MQIDDHEPALDVSTLPRRRALKLLGGAGLVAIVGAACASDDGAPSTGAGGSTTAAATSDTTAATGSACTQIPEETGGPFPGDGSNGPNVLAEDGVVRSDITSSIGSASGTAEGVTLTLELTVLDINNGCIPLQGAAVYAWHCDRDGGYSMYSAGIEDENYLRGVQVTDASGKLTFKSIFPGCYPGRWPHVHFEVYPSADAATSGSGKLATSQLAFPQAECEAAYAADGYDRSVGNLAQLSLDTDNVFADGYSAQLAKVTGSASDGFTAALTIAV